MAESERKPHRFKPGQSGNPKGRPQGSRSKRLVALDALAEGEVEEIVKKMIEKAKEGDAMAARPILDRVWPARKGARLTFRLSEVAEAKDIPRAIAEVTRQMADGELSPDEAVLIVGLLEAQRKAFETHDIAERVAALEQSAETERAGR